MLFSVSLWWFCLLRSFWLYRWFKYQILDESIWQLDITLFFRVMKSSQCQMDQNNLARVFGPTVVGHGMSEPSPTTIMRDTNTQPKVCFFLSRMWSYEDSSNQINMMNHFGRLHVFIFPSVLHYICCFCLRWCVACCPSLRPTGEVSSPPRRIRFRPPPLQPTARMVDMVGFILSVNSASPQSNHLYCCHVYLYQIYSRHVWLSAGGPVRLHCVEFHQCHASVPSAVWWVFMVIKL